MVNLTNPMLFKAPYREFIPSPPQQVTVKLPAGTKASAVKLLVSGQTLAPQQSTDGKITLTVPSILDFEVIAIDL
jgi:hypothetical protein